MNDKTILLYRFLDAESAIKTIEGGHFRVSRLSELNDPFEGMEGLGLNLYPPEHLEEAKKGITNSAKHLNEHFGLISFTRSPHNPVVWGHYADKHQGVAIEVSDLNTTVRPVDYDKPRVQLDPYKAHPDADDREEYMKKVLMDVLHTKFESWEYEAESRYILHLNICHQIKDGMYFMEIPEDYITRIILGIKCPYSVEYFERSLRKHGLKDVKVVRAEKDLYDFKINF